MNEANKLNYSEIWAYSSCASITGTRRFVPAAFNLLISPSSWYLRVFVSGLEQNDNFIYPFRGWHYPLRDVDTMGPTMRPQRYSGASKVCGTPSHTKTFCTFYMTARGTKSLLQKKKKKKVVAGQPLPATAISATTSWPSLLLQMAVHCAQTGNGSIVQTTIPTAGQIRNLLSNTSGRAFVKKVPCRTLLNFTEVAKKS